MATVEEMQKELEGRVNALIQEVGGRGREADWALVRALIHRGIHLCADRKAAEYCAVATFLAEQIGHAHELIHRGDAPGAAHGDVVH